MVGSSPNPDDNRTAGAGPMPAPPAVYPGKRRLVWGLLFLTFLVLAGLLTWGAHYLELLWAGVCHYYEVFTDHDNIQKFLKAAGPWAPVIFITVQSLQVVFAPIPGEATGFIGGYLFGVPLGLLYSTIGLTLGSVAAFLLGRWLEKHFVVRIVKPETLKRFEFLMGRQGTLVAFFLFLFPGFPKDTLCFILGLSHISLKLFLIMVTVGRLPGTLMLTLQGAKVYKGDYYITLFLVGACLILAGVMYYYREFLYEWLKRWDDHRNGPK